MIRVLFCTNKYSTIDHGPAKFANLIKAHVPKDDLELRVLAKDILPENESSDLIRLRRYASKYLPFAEMILNVWDYYLNARKIYKTYPFNIIVFNHGMLSLACSFFLKKTMKVVAMVNDYNSCTLSISRISFTRTWFRFYAFKLIERKAAQKASMVIVNSNFLKKTILDAYGLDPKKVKVLYKSYGDFGGINCSIKHLNKQEAICVGFIKSDVVSGGLKVLIEALNGLPIYRFRLVLIGPDQNSRRLHHILQLAEKHIEIQVLGKLAQQKVSEFLCKECQIFCVPSIVEGLGVSNMEAMLHHVAVVSTTAGGIPEVTGNSRFSWAAKPGNPKDLSIKINDCILQEHLRNQKIQAGKIFVEQKFNKDLVVSNFYKILTSEC